MNEIFKTYFLLGIATLLPVFVAIGLFIVDKYTRFKNLNKWVKQVIYGVIFGGLAILGTEFGVPMNGAQVNVRDAAVISAGLIFGWPAGIIAGTIGAVERWFAVYWGVGTFTRVACTVSTFIAGIYAALLRKFMFEDKRPGILLSLAIGVVIEVFHLTMVFVTNMSDPLKAMTVVKACSIPMITANGISVMLASIVPYYVDKKKKTSSVMTISTKIQTALLLTIFVAFAITSIFVYNLQDGIAEAQLEETLRNSLNEAIEFIDSESINSIGTTHISNDGGMMLLDESYNVIVKNENFNDDIKMGESTFNSHLENEIFTTSLYKRTYYASYIHFENYYILALISEYDAMLIKTITLYINTFMEIMVFALLFALIYLLIQRSVVSHINKVNESLSKITNGDLNEVVSVKDNLEFESLSNGINHTVNRLKEYIDEANKRIDKELEFAKTIQSSALPSTFPAYPKRRDIDIYAAMDAAKEVGGDFYDFYFTKTDIFHFLIADVSGKGIPGAMFMMRAKTELKSLTETGMSLKEVFDKGNEQLCEGNDANMFVTCWEGTIDLASGVLKFINAGHNPILIKHGNSNFEYEKRKSGFVLAGMEGMEYKELETELKPGDTVFLYTDGVTEAVNNDQELYGEDRLYNLINSIEFKSDKELVEIIKADVEKFSDGAEQADDITMLAFTYKGFESYPSISFDKASISDIDTITEFVDKELAKVEASKKIIASINIAIDEIYSNIVKYAYKDKSGRAEVRVIYKEDTRTICIRFSDNGPMYNPLESIDPDITLSADDREIGGLGIFMVKKTMDDIKYKYEDDENVLTIYKRLD